MFGEEVTPNHHALARQFTLFDNFYCSGVLSADGHPWVNEAYVTDYLEKAFGGFTRSYPYEGSDPLAFAAERLPLGQRPGRTRRRSATTASSSRPTYAPRRRPGPTSTPTTRTARSKVKIDVKAERRDAGAVHAPGLPRLPADDARRLPGQAVPRRAEGLRAEGRVARTWSIVYLPCDHTSGTTPGFPTPRAMVADNDLALGRVVEAVSKSKFWPETCIFVVEDDPQNGFDHVDGHRTRRPGHQPVHEAQVRRSHQLQPDRHGQDDRADPRPAADEPARPVGHADARLLPGQARPDAVHLPCRTRSRWTR